MLGPRTLGAFQEPSAHPGPDGMRRPWPCEARLTAGAVPEAHGAAPPFPAGWHEADGRGGASPLHAYHGPSRLWETPAGIVNFISVYPDYMASAYRACQSGTTM